MQSPKELWTLYSKSDTVYHIKKLISSDNKYILLTYVVNTSHPEAAKQDFIKQETISKTDLFKIKSEYSSYNWTPLKNTPTLFVQINGSAFTYDLEPWDKREAILDQIEKSLQKSGNAEWIGCDVGPGGLNLIFELENISGAIPKILDILSKYGYDKKTIIGRRINTTEDDWFYEVIYPLDYNGVFLTM